MNSVGTGPRLASFGVAGRPVPRHIERGSQMMLNELCFICYTISMSTKAEKREVLQKKLRKKRASLAQQVKRRVKTATKKISVSWRSDQS